MINGRDSSEGRSCNHSRIQMIEVSTLRFSTFSMQVQIEKIPMFSVSSVQFGKGIDGDHGQSYDELIVT